MPNSRWAGDFSQFEMFCFTLQSKVSSDRSAKAPITDFLLKTWGELNEDVFGMFGKSPAEAEPNVFN